MSRVRTVLVVAERPDRRESTDSLRRLVVELRSRPGVRAEVWFLRVFEADDEPWWGDATDVDSLRTWWPARATQLVGLGLVASWLRGRRLRRWLAELAPDLVLLDDGLGDRLLSACPGHPFVVARRNPLPAPGAEREGAPVATPDAEWVAPDMIDTTKPTDLADRTRDHHRSRCGVPADAALVVGWGGTGWLDGPDLFVRALWHLEHREGLVAHGLWLRTDDDAEALTRLTAEARRCGVGDRFHLGVDGLDGSRLCADAVFLPYRVPIPNRDLLPVMGTGLAIVTFPTIDAREPAIWRVDPLDLDAAGSELARALRRDPAEARRLARASIDVVARADELLAMGEQRRP